MTAFAFTDDLHLLLNTLPPTLREVLRGMEEQDLLEIVLDLGRLPQARYPERCVHLAETAVTRADIEQVVSCVGEFGADNRAGIEGTLHRISALRNRKGHIIGLTLRVGRAVFGTIDQIRDLIESGKSVLLLGRPGVGKTTKLREVARVLADEFNKRVIVIDTSNEIAGDGDIPHPAIGSARRMQVPHPDRQHAVMIEAVENHMPEVIIVDEIGTEAEAIAARTIAERGVQLIGTAHGNTLQNLLLNPTLSDLVGGVQTVTLGDEEARLRGTQKTVSERKAPPTFASVVEIVDREDVIVHRDTASAVDALLHGANPGGVRRTPGGGVSMDEPARQIQTTPPKTVPLIPEQRNMKIYPYALSRDLLERAIRDLGLNARAVSRIEHAGLILALRSRTSDLRLQHVLEVTRLPMQAVRKNTTSQIRRVLKGLFNVVEGVDDAEVNDAVCEVEAAVHRVMEERVSVSLSPRSASIRKIQHRVVSRYHLVAESMGSESQRHLVVYPAHSRRDVGTEADDLIIH
jgi:stage III sporulation protein SpoIIIAA